MKRLYPTVRLVWNKIHRRWGLLDVTRGRQRRLIRWVERPDMSVMQALRESSEVRRLAPGRLQEWMDRRLYEPEERAIAEADARSSERFMEGADRLYHRFAPYHSVSFHGKPHRRQKP